MKRILALLPSQVGFAPGQRSSIELWRRPLEAADIALEYAPFETAQLRSLLGQRGRVLAKALEMARCYAARVRLLRNLERFDAVYVYREAALIGPAILERWVKRRGKPIIYSLDDPLYIPYVSPTSGWYSYLKCFGKVGSICRLSDVVIVNSRFHADFASRYNRNVWQIPSLIDEERYRFRERHFDSSRICVGWSGSHSSAANLTLIASALQELAARRDYRLLLVGAPGLKLPGVDCTSRPWREATEVVDLEEMDVGLAPLLDNEWNRRKFNMKIAQYMALGIVPVATPLGSNTEIINHGQDGFLASSEKDWVSCLTQLLDDPDLRREMAYSGVKKAHTQFTVGTHAQTIVKIFRSVLS